MSDVAGRRSADGGGKAAVADYMSVVGGWKSAVGG
jgi:hypothetical protein